jgi:hypothetical protein
MMKRKAIILAAVVGLATAVAMAGQGQAEPTSRLLDRFEAQGPKITHAAPTVDGGVWLSQSFINRLGDFCLSRQIPGELTAADCTPDRAGLLKGRNVYALHGARVVSSPVRKLEWDNMWVQGLVSPTVASVEIVNMDCSRTSIPFDADGVFIHVVSSEEIRQDDVPYKLIARSLTGEIVHEQSVDAGITPNALEAGHSAPKPQASCA